MGLHISQTRGDPTEQDIPNLANDLISIPTREDRALRHFRISITAMEGWYTLAKDLAPIDQAITKERFPRLEVFDLALMLLTDEDNDLQTTEEYAQERKRNSLRCREIFRQVGILDGVEFKCEVFMVLNVELFRR